MASGTASRSEDEESLAGQRASSQALGTIPKTEKLLLGNKGLKGQKRRLRHAFARTPLGLTLARNLCFPDLTEVLSLRLSKGGDLRSLM